MARNRFVPVALMLFLVLAAGPAAYAQAQSTASAVKPALPTVVVLATGGTIAGAAASDVQAGYTSGQVGMEQLLAAVEKTCAAMQKQPGFVDVDTAYAWDPTGLPVVLDDAAIEGVESALWTEFSSIM